MLKIIIIALDLLDDYHVKKKTPTFTSTMLKQKRGKISKMVRKPWEREEPWPLVANPSRQHVSDAKNYIK